jgi:hypothetical protein
MSRHVYLDTCAWMRFAEGSIENPTERDKNGRAIVEGLIQSDAILATCEIALIEFHDSIGRRVRDGNAPQFTEDWFQSATAALMSLVAESRVIIVPVPPKAIENAMALMTIAHRDQGIAFHAWDATHLIVALAWGVTLNNQVEIATCDTDFPRFVDSFPHFKPYVAITMVA